MSGRCRHRRRRPQRSSSASGIVYLRRIAKRGSTLYILFLLLCDLAWIALMNRTVIIGCVVILAALGVITYLVLWSRRTIDWIANRRLRSAREIVKELRGDR